MRFGSIFIALCLLMAGLPAAEAQTRSERVQFARGASDTTVRGAVRGYETVSYFLGASAGQRMVLDFQTDNPSAYFNVTAPGMQDAIFIGATTGNRFDAMVPSSGDYVVTVYLMRNAARRDETSNYYLTLAVYGRAPPPPPVAGPPPRPDGAGFWEVAGLTPGDTLNLREQPSTQSMVLLKFYPGQILRDLGCAMAGGQQWCQVQAPDWSSPKGWVAGRYLRKALAPPGFGGPPSAGYPPPGPGYPPITYPPPVRPPVAGPVRSAKCRQDSTLCTSEAARLCGGSYRVIDSESHAGGLISDALPGPFAWYAMTYVCGPSDGRYPTFAFRGPPLQFPGIGFPGGGGGGAQSVKVSEMPRFCRGEAAAKFKVRPQNIVTQSADRRDNGDYVVRGRYPARQMKMQPFTCEFDKRRVFKRVRAVSN